jgi:hypothetical protein
MTNPSRNKGTAWETAVVRYLAGRGLRARRKPLAGNQDKADIDLDEIPGIVIEAKNTNRTEMAKFMDQAVLEAVHAGAKACAVWQHRRREQSPGSGYVIMTGDHFTEVLLELRDLREQVRLLVAMQRGEVVVPAATVKRVLDATEG